MHTFIDTMFFAKKVINDLCVDNIEVQITGAP